MADDPTGSREPMLTVDETAAWLRVSPWSVRRMARDGYLKAIRLRPHVLRFQQSEVERCMADMASRKAPTGQTAARPLDDQELQPLLDAVAELIASAWRAKQATA